MLRVKCAFFHSFFLFNSPCFSFSYVRSVFHRVLRLTGQTTTVPAVRLNIGTVRSLRHLKTRVAAAVVVDADHCCGEIVAVVEA